MNILDKKHTIEVIDHPRARRQKEHAGVKYITGHSYTYRLVLINVLLSDNCTIKILCHLSSFGATLKAKSMYYHA